MTTHDYIDIALAVLGLLLGIIGYLLINQVKDVKTDIERLYAMHHVDEKELNSLKLDVAKNYPMKEELRIMANEIKDYFDERFKVVEALAKNNFGDRTHGR